MENILFLSIILLTISLFLFWKIYQFTPIKQKEEWRKCSPGDEVKIIYHTLTPNVIRVDINWSDAIHDSAVQKFDLIENKILHGLNKEIIKLLMENKNCIKVDIDNSSKLKRITAKAVIYLQPIEQ